MPKYSETKLDDNNVDNELKKLSETIGVAINKDNYSRFVHKLDNQFTCQKHTLGFDEWIALNVQDKNHPLYDPNYKPIYQRGEIAYEFKNGFIVLHLDIPIQRSYATISKQ